MASKNVDAVRSAHESWNRRDFDGVVRYMADNATYTDNASGVTFNSKQQFREWVEGWAKAFSNGKIVNPQYIDAGDTVVAQFTVQGTNDGPFAGLPPTGRRSSMAFCEILHFDNSGRITSGGAYYDQYKMLTELGHIQPLRRAA